MPKRYVYVLQVTYGPIITCRIQGQESGALVVIVPGWRHMR